MKVILILYLCLGWSFSQNTVKTTALWTFDEQVEIYPSCVLSDQSENVFSTFREMSQATGGFSGSSFYPTETFRKALDASENYYLVYYSPLNYTQDGEFKNVKIRVKGKNYKITHRAGYFAD